MCWCVRRPCAKDYVGYVLTQRTGPVFIDVTESREDLSIINVPEASTNRSTLFAFGSSSTTILRRPSSGAFSDAALEFPRHPPLEHHPSSPRPPSSFRQHHHQPATPVSASSHQRERVLPCRDSSSTTPSGSEYHQPAQRRLPHLTHDSTRSLRRLSPHLKLARQPEQTLSSS